MYPSLVDIDSGFPDEGIRGLLERGHNVSGECFHTSSVNVLHSMDSTRYTQDYECYTGDFGKERYYIW